MLLKENAIRKERIRNNTEKISYNYLYVFKCKQCDEEIRVQVQRLKISKGTCVRCCQKKEPYKFIYNELIKTLKRRNKHHGDEVLNFEEFTNLIKDNNCHYCGTEVIYNKHSRDEKGNALSRAYQMDRKDNTVGYSKNNLVVCCWTCNRLKSDAFTYEEFIKLSPMLKIIMKNRKNERI